MNSYAKFIKFVCQITFEPISEKCFMLSFEVSAIDIVLMIAVIILLMLYVGELSTGPRTELRHPAKTECLGKTACCPKKDS